MSSPDTESFRARVIDLARSECEEIRRERDEAAATIVRLASEFAFPYKILREAGEEIEPLSTHPGGGAAVARLEEEISEYRESVERLVIERDKAVRAIGSLNDALAAKRSEAAEATTRAEALTQQLESERKEPKEGGPKSPGPSAEESEGRSSERKPPVTVTLERVRDWACDQTGQFSTGDLAKHFDLSGSTAKRLIDLLVKQGSVQRPDGSPTMGRAARWERAPLPKDAPTTKPRGSPSPSRRTHAPTPVPGTGVPAGPASTPGALKRQQRKARRVKPKPVKGVRA